MHGVFLLYRSDSCRSIAQLILVWAENVHFVCHEYQIKAQNISESAFLFLKYTLSNSFTNLAMKPTSVVWDLWTTVNGRIVLVCGIKWITATFKKMNSLWVFLHTGIAVHGHSYHSFKNAFNLFNVYTSVSIDSNILHHMTFFQLLEKLFQRMAQLFDFWWKMQ